MYMYIETCIFQPPPFADFIIIILLFFSLCSFKISHILSSPDDSWQGLSGRVSSELLKTNLPKLQDQKNNVLVCVCGPLPFTAAMTDILLDTDYPEHCIHIFQ